MKLTRTRIIQVGAIAVALGVSVWGASLLIDRLVGRRPQAARTCLPPRSPLLPPLELVGSFVWHSNRVLFFVSLLLLPDDARRAFIARVDMARLSRAGDSFAIGSKGAAIRALSLFTRISFVVRCLVRACALDA